LKKFQRSIEERYDPTFVLVGRYGRRQVQTVSKALGTLPGATKLLYMQTPKASLAGITPLEALATAASTCARRHAETVLHDAVAQHHGAAVDGREVPSEGR
jgi:hypothetical protein